MARDCKKVLDARSIRKSYDLGTSRIEVLKGIDLKMETGDLTCIMGPSGSGKSTLLNIISGLLSCDSGNVYFGASDITRMSEAELTVFRRKNIGLVFQDFNLIPTLSAEENILLPLMLDGKEGEKEVLDNLLEVLGIEERRKHLPAELSGGERQRVAIGRALMANPEIIFADEPTGNLDSISGKNLCMLLKKLNEEQGRTILMVTHNPSVAVWAKKVVFIKDGVIVDTIDISGTHDPSVVADHYLSLLNGSEVSA